MDKACKYGQNLWVLKTQKKRHFLICFNFTIFLFIKFCTFASRDALHLVYKAECEMFSAFKVLAGM